MADAPHPVTVVLRSYNDAALLPHTLGALSAQEGVEVRLSVFESASTDGSKEILERHGYHRIEHLAPGSYHSAKVLNDGTNAADTELVAYLNSDAIMMSRHVLRRLADAILAHESSAGAFSRQIVRPNATPLTRLDYFTAFENRHELGRFENHMSLVCSMVRKSVWARVPFDSGLTFAEDYVWSHRVLEQGYTLHYVPEAVVEHSHNYSSAELYRRHFGDSAALASIREHAPDESALSGFVVPWLKRCAHDTLRLWRMGSLKTAVRVPAYRYPMLLGEWRGALAGWKHFRVEKRTDRQPTAPPRQHGA